MALETQGAIGPEGTYDLKLEGGKIVVSVQHNHASGYVKLEAAEDVKYFLEKLRGVLPPWASIAINLAEASVP